MNLLPILKHKFLDANGNPLVGGKLYSYVAGTTTPQATYTDSSGGTPNANPVVLDANGEANVWIDPALTYKFVLADSDDVTQFTADNVTTAGTVHTENLADGAVTEEKIGDGEVTSAKLATGVANTFNIVEFNPSTPAETYNVVGDEALILVDASAAVTSATVQLPAITAALAGRVIRIKLAGADLADVAVGLTIAATGGDSFASGSAAIQLSTPGELVALAAHGTTWVVVDHKANGTWEQSGITITGATGNPTKGGTSVDRIIMNRHGGYWTLRYEYRQGTAGAAGTGDYFFAFPTGVGIETGLINSTHTQYVGNGTVNSGAGDLPIVVKYEGLNKFTLVEAGTDISATKHPLSSATLIYVFEVRIPVANDLGSTAVDHL